jgi:peptide-methionine (S)-S-oxide reductase
MIMMNMKYPSFSFLLLFIFALSCGAREGKLQQDKIFSEMTENKNATTHQLDTATFGGGCFWCTEAQIQLLDGVSKVVSGYTGGVTKNPTYKEVCSGLTGHAEVIQVTFDPAILSYDALLAAFWQAHDPTQLNRQGNDEGTQYRSVIFYHNEEQKKIAEQYKNRLNEEKAYDKPVVTEIAPLSIFYPGEGYHQNYFNENGNQGYCMFVIQPKVDKFKKVFQDKLKK